MEDGLLAGAAPFPISITARLRFTATCNKLLVARVLGITSEG
jgi:hypothetical protein